MRLQHRIKTAIKRRLVADRDEIRRIRFGPGRGVRCILNRRTDIQREFGLYESELAHVYHRVIRPDSVVYDIGAADGVIALIFAKLASAGHVVAFEPDGAQATRFEQNLALNPDLASRVRLWRVAVQPGTVDFDELQPPDFVKIDVDGAELDVLVALERTLRRHTPTLVVETHGAQLEQQCRRRLELGSYAVEAIRNAWWRSLYPEWRPIEQNRWLLARRTLASR